MFGAICREAIAHFLVHRVRDVGKCSAF